ncbi:peptide chain release factor N(5)-glutamine methyltransferase [Flavobacterium sp. J27]|uniref:peptide chain release factor N(5)-glutamine methyltransferase n=1 Tax=Flavobacterium sp. J27 TaxID=2060419 RepID=UPI0010309A6F|nr:peptide chain release factor N(5)-glutamine methyltransferase [Flavobacterium sp. J27]
MLLKEYKLHFTATLQTKFDALEIESFFFIILEHLHQMKRVDLALEPHFELTAIALLKWNDILSQLEQEKPIQYILGETEFYGLHFYVDENTLIPRPETEELVQWIITSLQNNSSQKITILDIGTGSGCIPISLQKNIPNAKVAAIDVSKEALQVAERNAVLNQTAVYFIHQDILQTEALDEVYDIIVSNPPYVRHLEKEDIKKNVLEYEPHLALFVSNDDALLFYRKIAQLAKHSLSVDGQLFFEINQYLGPETITLLEQLGFQNIELKKDFYGNDRMIRCTL